MPGLSPAREPQTVEILSSTPANPEFGQGAALFDDYRVHYGQQPDPDGSRRWLTAQIGSGRLTIAVAVRDEQVCGLITTMVQPASLRLGVAWAVRDLFVAPGARRGGIARALLDHVIAEARVAGALRVSLQTEPENGPALALYASLGFRPVDGLESLTLRLS